MFEEQVRIHDKLSVEIKLGFKPLRKQKTNDWSLNTWIFIPRGLDITASTYQKSDFYRDLKSNIRLITPILTLRELAETSKSPLTKLKDSFLRLSLSLTRGNIADYEYHIRLFLAILKSTLRDEILIISKIIDSKHIEVHVEKYTAAVQSIASDYRNLKKILAVESIHSDVMNYYLFGDEFMSNIIEHNTFKLLKILKDRSPKTTGNWDTLLPNLIKGEIEYKKTQGFPAVERNSPDHNRRLLSRLWVLKKFSESELYLNAIKRKDGVIIEQVYLSIAAGISMVFATAIAFSFQQKFGNLTMPFFVALVISYMLKDRLKELVRFYFAHKLGRFYFDQKTNISLKNELIGSIREALDHIEINKVPADIIKLRSRSSVFDEYAREHADSVMLYRKLVKLNRLSLDKISSYPMPGIHEIIRINISEFLRKMDNPKIPLFVPDPINGYDMIEGEKVYYLNLIFQMKNKNNILNYHYRVVMNRNGILDIETIT